MIKVAIQSVSFGSEGEVEMTYMLPESDVKAPGLARMHTILIPKGYEYDDEMAALSEAADLLLLDVLEDFESQPSAYENDTPA